ncbi:MAG: T9SS type A sorting domain-containing protein, partial [Bacteroidales bacterium]|nr:T9SS type A sorting domain-containing protein [Bacteroidales bacterium]
TVYSITGQEMLKLNNTKTVDVSGLAAGSYLVKVKSGDNIMHKKLIVEKN